MDEQGRAMNQPFPADDQRVNIIDILGSTLNTEGIEDQAKVLTEGNLYSDDCLTVCISLAHCCAIFLCYLGCEI